MRKTLFILFILTSLHAYSQNYQKGYIIKNSKDTLHGWIDYRTDRINAHQCTFKTETDTSPHNYTPADIAGYKLLDEKNKEIYYISKEITIGENKQTVFLEFLVQGVINLYFYQSNTLGYYFFEDEYGGTTYITKNKDEIATTNKGNEYNKEDTKYKGELRYKFKDIPEVADLAYKTNFNHQSMIKLVKKYHDLTCSTGEQCVIYEGKSNKQVIKFKFSAYVGATYLSSSEIHGFNMNHQKPDMEKNSPLIGGIIHFYSPRWSEILSATLDLSVSRLKGENKSSNLYKISSLTASGKIGPKLTLPSRKIRPFLEGGYMHSMIFNDEIKCYNIMYNLEMEYDYKIGNSYTGYYCNLGVDYLWGKKNAVFCKVTYKKAISAPATNLPGLEFWGLKAGYTF